MIDVQTRDARVDKLHIAMSDAGVDIVAISPTTNMRYLLGFAPLADERPCFLLVGRATSRLLVPEVNANEVESRTGMNASRWPDSAGPHRALKQALDELGVEKGAVLAADDSMRADALLLLQSELKPGTTIAAGELMAGLRMIKSEGEIATLKRSALMADKAILAGAAACQPGVQEREVAETIARTFRELGADAIDFTGAASGPNSAFPHHEYGDRVLQTGDMIVMDIGAVVDGYQSDVTRMVHMGEPSDEEREVYSAVLEANRQGRAAAVAGALARDVDKVTRDVIEKAGYGPNFVHRTGHGLGMDVHEPPWITSESETVLQPGMVFSVEPGVYLPGKFGVRIEDIVVVTEGQSVCLGELEHDLIIR